MSNIARPTAARNRAAWTPERARQEHLLETLARLLADVEGLCTDEAAEILDRVRAEMRGEAPAPIVTVDQWAPLDPSDPLAFRRIAA